MAEGEIELWAQSPALELSFEVSETARQDWKLTVHNLMPSVIVEQSAGLLSLSEESADSNTTRVWRLTLTPSSTGSMRLASPDAFEPGPFRIIYFSDLQEGIETWQVYSEALAAVPEVRFALFGGDLSNRGGAEEFERCAAALSELPFPVYQTPGNHDFGSSQALWSRDFGPHSFHFSYKGVGFSLADSASATLDASTYSRLQEWLGFPREAQHLFVTHYPLFDPVGTRNGAFRSRSEAAKLAGRLAAADVDLLLFGHVHSYYAFSVAQIPAFIAGGATPKLERMTGIGRHFLRLDIAEGGIEVSLMRIQE
jgi:predicted phosphodiesterase